MADSGKNDPRRKSAYALPGEIDTACLELELEQLAQRLGAEPRQNPARGSGAAQTVIHEPRSAPRPPQLDAEPYANPRSTPAPPAGIYEANPVPPPPQPTGAESPASPVRTPATQPTEPRSPVVRNSPAPPTGIYAASEQQRSSAIRNSAATQTAVLEEELTIQPPQLGELEGKVRPSPVRNGAALPTKIPETKSPAPLEEFEVEAPAKPVRSIAPPPRLVHQAKPAAPPKLQELRADLAHNSAAPAEIPEPKPIPAVPRSDAELSRNPAHSAALPPAVRPEANLPVPPPGTERHANLARNTAATPPVVREPQVVPPPPRLDTETRPNPVRNAATPSIPPAPRLGSEPGPNTIRQAAVTPTVKPSVPPPQHLDAALEANLVHDTATVPRLHPEARPVPPPPRLDPEPRPSAVRHAAATPTLLPETKRVPPAPRPNTEPRPNPARTAATAKTGARATRPAPRVPKLGGAQPAPLLTRLQDFASNIYTEGRSSLLDLLQYLNGSSGSPRSSSRHSSAVRHGTIIPRPAAPVSKPVQAIPLAKPIPAPRLDGALRPRAVPAGSAAKAGKVVFARTGVSARLALLPDQKPRWGRMGVSAVGQLAFLGFLLLTPMLFPQTMKTALHYDIVEIMQPVTEVKIEPAKPEPVAEKPKPKLQPKPKIKPKAPPKAPEIKPDTPEQVELVPQLNPKQPHIFMNLKPQIKKVRVVQEDSVDFKPVLKQEEIVLSTAGPAAPPAPATVNAPADKVQTGGFGDPNGVKGPGNPNKGSNINQGGSPQLPGGPGYGNGTGGANGLRGTIASDGTGRGGVAAAPPGNSGVGIVYKPNPSYTEEARGLKAEGDVVLEVVFLASGQIQVLRVVSGLGHGLDEAAVAAAKQIRFNPAKRNGQAVDFPARVRIEFRLSK